MSRVLILSDIHSNLPAFEAVLADAEKRGGFDAVWCLGDTVGYGAQPNECLDRLRALDPIALAGNHDLGAIGAISLDDFNDYARAANLWTGRELTPENRDYLAGLLPLQIVEEWTLAHGTPQEPVWDYLVSRDAAESAFEAMASEWGLVGHSHLPLIAEQTAGGRIALERLPAGAPVALAGRRLILNPGSVGQPRDRDPRAAYAILDRAAGVLTPYRVPYEIAAAQELIIDAGLPRILADRLDEGW